MNGRNQTHKQPCLSQRNWHSQGLLGTRGNARVRSTPAAEEGLEARGIVILDSCLDKISSLRSSQIKMAQQHEGLCM